MNVTNPFLPACEYIPDGEPHVFGERIYLFGSHDKFNGEDYCLNDYICYSAGIDNLSKWRYEGIIYRKVQDPRNLDGKLAMYAPDVVKGIDGRFYLYYCLEPLSAVAVAVCDRPAGKYEYLGLVHYDDGTVLGEREGDYRVFDPGVMVDDDNQVWLYLGNGPRNIDDNERKASFVVELKNDMLTIRKKPKRLIPTIKNSAGTGFEGHEFFEASSIRKNNNTYYFIYSSILSHELCYATSQFPDKDFLYGGTIISIGDIGYRNRHQNDLLNYIGNTHGSIVQIYKQWYVFYHRQTNQTQYCRQACAEKIYFMPDGTIPQVELTSCGLSNAPLRGTGTYDARIACILKSGVGANYSHPMALRGLHPYFTQDMCDLEPSEFNESDYRKKQYIKNIGNNTLIGYKYFMFNSLKSIIITIRGKAKGILQVMNSLEGEVIGEIIVSVNQLEWTVTRGDIQMPDGIYGLYFRFIGEGSLEFIEFTLIDNNEDMSLAPITY